MECCNCGAPATHSHHIVPRAVGGTDRPSNLAPVCETCHGLIHERRFVRHGELCRQGLAASKARGQQLGSKHPAVAEANSKRSAEATAYAKQLAPIVLPMRERGDSLATIAAALTEAGTATTKGGTATKWSDNGVKRLLSRL